MEGQKSGSGKRVTRKSPFRPLTAYSEMGAMGSCGESRSCLGSAIFSASCIRQWAKYLGCLPKEPSLTFLQQDFWTQNFIFRIRSSPLESAQTNPENHLPPDPRH